MPRTSTASLVLHTSATADDVWAAIRGLDFRNPPLSSCGISPEIEVAHIAAAQATAAAAAAFAGSDAVYDELSQLANPGRASQAPPSRYIAERTALMQSDPRCYRVAWVERERSHRDLMEDVRVMKKQARRRNEIRVVPITTPGQVVAAGASRACNRVFIEWRSSATIFCSNGGTVPYRSKLTTAPAERVGEMQHGLTQLCRMFDATVTLSPAQAEALLVEQHSAGPDSRFLCSARRGGTAVRGLLEGRYWELCNRGAVGQAVLARAAELFPAAADSAAAQVSARKGGQQQQQQISAHALALDSCMAEAITDVLGQAGDGGGSAGGSGVEAAEAAEEDRVAVLALGVAALHAFMQVNFTGPRFRAGSADDDASALKTLTDVVQTRYLASTAAAAAAAEQPEADGSDGGGAATTAHRSPYDYPAEQAAKDSRTKSSSSSSSSSSSASSASAWRDYLDVDGEAVYAHIARPELLCVASAVLRALDRLAPGDAGGASAGPALASASLQSLWSAPWWLMRCTATWQRVIEDSYSQSLWDVQTRCFRALEQRGVTAGDGGSGGDPAAAAAAAEHEAGDDVEAAEAQRRGAHWWAALEMPATLGVTRQSLRALAQQERAVALAGVENYHGARECVQRAGRALGVRIVVTGALGRGTKFQTFDTPQLVAIVQRYDDASDEGDEDGGAASTSSGSSSSSTTTAPATKEGEISLEQKRHIAKYLHGQKLRDGREAAGVRTVTIESVDPYSHLLEQPILSERRAAERVNSTMPAIAQAMMLAECKYLQGSAAVDATVRSQLQTFLAQTVRHPQSWAIQTLALFEKSLLELKQSRLPERALLQLQALVDQHTSFIRPALQHNFMDASEVPVAERMKLVHALDFQPYWAVKRAVGEQYLRAGLVKSALQLFESLQMWNEIIHCYVLTGERTKAEKLLREQLAAAPTPDLWCVLGGLTKDDAHLHRAWAESGGTCARAMRDLARAEMKRGEVDAAIQHMRAALDLNPLRPHDWFFLGMASQKAERPSFALDCFKHVVQILPDSAEAWGNLGALHGQLGNYPEAMGSMEEAAKLRPRNWRVWANMRLFALRARRWHALVQAATRLLDLHEDMDLHKTGALVDAGALLALVDTFDAGDLRHWADVEAEEKAAGRENALALTTTAAPAVAAAAAASTNAAAVDVGGPSRLARELPRMYWAVRLLRRSCKLDSENPGCWAVAAELERRLGRAEGALDCTLKQCRATMVASWAEDGAKFSRVVSAALALAKSYLAVGTADALYRGRMFLGRSILRHAEEHFKGGEDYARLEKAVAELEAASPTTTGTATARGR